jgi:integrative and conjugative element protein (TIGR02256 family)
VEIDNMDIVIQLKDKKIKLDKSIVNLMNRYRQESKKDPEAGGILIGRENKDSGNIIIEYATEPYHKDKRTRTSFLRRDKKHMEYFTKLYNEYNGTYAYIGEWHTHPEDYPNYSSIDINNWNSISKLNNVDKEKVYYHVIVGNKEIGVWEYGYSLKHANRIY